MNQINKSSYYFVLVCIEVGHRYVFSHFLKSVNVFPRTIINYSVIIAMSLLMFYTIIIN